jgi:hypothetical protein
MTKPRNRARLTAYGPVMRAAIVISIVATACGGTAARRPATPAPIGNTATATAPATATFEFEVSGTRWQIDVPGAEQRRDPYGFAQFETLGWSVAVGELPASEVFVQTLQQDLDHVATAHTDYEVLYQRDNGADDWADVVRIENKIYGSRKITGAIAVTCSFELAIDTDWHPALAACDTVRPSDLIAPVNPCAGGEGF